MKFPTVGCLAFVAIFGTVSTASQPLVHFGLSPLFGNSRITNGQAAVPHAYPYQLSLEWRRWSINSPQPVCGASLISSTWVVTAAHCFGENPNFGSYAVFAGKHNIHATEVNRQLRDAVLIVIHPDYLGGVNPHDIALVKVRSPFNFNEFVAPIALPKKNIVHSGYAVITGWGSTSVTTSPTRPIVLQTATVPILDNDVCYTVLSSFAENPPLDPRRLDNVCAGFLDDSRISVCTGDSGGPLAQQIGERWELIGVTSYTVFPCGTIGAPSVFVRTSAYVDWINAQIAANN